MNPTITIATARRVLTQIRHDHRTVAMLLVVPVLLMTLLWWMFDGGPAWNRVGAPLLGIFPFVIMFLVTSVTTLRERTSGTLERLLSMPLGRLDFLLGYAIGFGLMAFLQAVVASAVAIGLLGLEVAGPAWLLLLVAVVDAVLGVALGLLVSAFAANEFQAVQFMPAVVLPQFLLCGLLVPREQLPTVLNWLSDVLPLSYAVDATKSLAASAQSFADVGLEMSVVVAFIVGSLALGSLTLRRQVA